MPESLAIFSVLNFTEFGKKNDSTVYKLLDSKRAFLMGNALVVGVVTKLGDSLYKFHE